MNIPLLKAAGLHTSVNELSAIPSGALAVAQNVVIRAKDVIEPRRGQERESAAFGNSINARAREVFHYGGLPFIFFQDTIASVDQNRLTKQGTLDQFATDFTPADADVRPKFFEAAGNLYFNSANGVYRLDSTSGTPVKAGGPKPIDLASSFTITATAGSWLADDGKVAYRVVFGFKDANDNLHLGPPSGRAFAINTTGGVANVDVTVPLPSWVTAGMFARIYRSETVAVTLGSEEPSDDLGLVYEFVLTSTEISAKTFTFVDRTPDTFRGTNLYTNPNSGEGILQANESPPFCTDMALWANRGWYANTRQVQRRFLDLLGIGASATTAGAGFGYSGLRLGDTITFGGLTYTAHTSQIPADGKFLMATASAFASVNVAETARSLVQVINTRTANTTHRAYYISGPSDPPGKILIEAIDLTAVLFDVQFAPKEYVVASASASLGTTTVVLTTTHDWVTGDYVSLVGGVGVPVELGTTTTGTNTFTAATADIGTPVAGNEFVIRFSRRAWNPELIDVTFDGSGLAYLTAPKSSDDETVNRLYYSKIQQTEAVPLLNYFDVGVRGKAIKRVVPLRDKLIVFKEEGVYLVSGEAPFRVDLLDDTVRILAPDTAVAASNQVFALTNQGVVSVSDSGVKIVSRQIEGELNPYLFQDGIDSDAFGVAHDTDRLYSLWLPALDGAEGPYFYGRAYVFNVLLGVWTTWELERTCGRVSPTDDHLYMGSTELRYIYKDRNDGDYSDYADSDREDLTVSSGGWDETTKILDCVDEGGAAVGDVIDPNPTVGAGVPGIVLALLGSGQLLMSGGTFPDFGTISDRKVRRFAAIPCEVTWSTIDAENPTEGRQITEIHTHFRKQNIRTYSLDMATDQTPAGRSFDVTDTTHAPAADLTLVGIPEAPKFSRKTVPQTSQRGAYHRLTFSTNEAYAYWALNGVTLVGNTTGPSSKK